MPDTTLRSIVFDCARPAALARFWADALGYAVRPYDQVEIDRLQTAGLSVEDDPSVVIDPPDGVGPTIWFNRVPEPKVVKNRVHLDINVPSLAAIETLLSRGAQIVRPLGAVPDEPWLIMRDPEGNEFCVFPPAHEASPA